MYKILVGIPAMFVPGSFKKFVTKDGCIRDAECEDDADVWMDFSVEQNEDGEFYLTFETMLAFETPEKCREWIEVCLNVFTEYMNDKGFPTDKELSLWDVFTYGANVNKRFDTIEEAYALMKFLVHGFHGNGIPI